ncbi:MAG TPA: hypothetical protein VN717_01460 [Gemmatimonadaceae bacterium]|nr:hypothetical protein [Gemmatimonadaceae bacterium]
MRATNCYIVLAALTLAAVGCSDSTGLSDCSYPSTTASFAPTEPGILGVITSIKYSSGRTPEGGISSQVDVVMSAITATDGQGASSNFPPGMKLHIVLGSTTPVFMSHGSGTPAASSACELALLEKVNVGMPLSDIFGFGDFVGESENSLNTYAIEPTQVEILGF